MNNKTILVDAHVFDEKHQGTRTYIKGLYSHLILIATDWHFFLAGRNVDNLNAEFGSHTNVTFIKLKSKNKIKRLLIEFPRIVREYNIAYSHYQYICPVIKNCKFIITTHDILFEQEDFKNFFPLKYRLINSFLFKRSAKKADLLLTVSKYSKDKISKHYNINQNNIYITPNAVDVERLIKCNTAVLEIKDKFILYVSRIEPRKNHLILLESYIELKLYEKGYKLVFIGKKDLPYTDLEIYISENKQLVNDYVIWLDAVTQEKLSAYYRQCEIFIFPSLAEGFGIPPLEAMAFGCKLLCSNATAMADFNIPEELFFNPKNKEELKKKLTIELNRKDLPFGIYDKTLAMYNWIRIAQNFYKLVQEHHKALSNEN